MEEKNKCQTCGGSKEVEMAVPMKMSGSVSSVPDILHKPCPDCNAGELAKKLRIIATNLLAFGETNESAAATINEAATTLSRQAERMGQLEVQRDCEKRINNELVERIEGLEKAIQIAKDYIGGVKGICNIENAMDTLDEIKAALGEQKK